MSQIPAWGGKDKNYHPSEARTARDRLSEFHYLMRCS